MAIIQSSAHKTLSVWNHSSHSTVLYFQGCRHFMDLRMARSIPGSPDWHKLLHSPGHLHVTQRFVITWQTEENSLRINEAIIGLLSSTIKTALCIYVISVTDTSRST